MTSAFSWQNSISLCFASFRIPRPNLPVTPGVSWLPTFAFQSPIMKRTSFLTQKWPSDSQLEMSRGRWISAFISVLLYIFVLCLVGFWLLSQGLHSFLSFSHCFRSKVEMSHDDGADFWVKNLCCTLDSLQAGSRDLHCYRQLWCSKKVFLTYFQK